MMPCHGLFAPSTQQCSRQPRVQELYRCRVLEKRYMEGRVIAPLLARAVQQYEAMVQLR